eukprot:m.334995 g.334995  ORF g.334995 m.334995 type:complete len:409 (-) comp17490_c0_seq1:105-1331(-)
MYACNMAPSLSAVVVVAVALLQTVQLVNGHAAMVIPHTRNSEDSSLPEFQGGKSPDTPCTCANGVGNQETGCDLGARGSGGGGQPCLWWSQGCSIGCPICATNMTDGKIPTKPITGNPPHTDKAGFRKSYCENPTTTSTLPRNAWTMNINAVEGSVNDSYRFNPWRAPGSAPIVDACGQAGGKFPQTPMGGDSTYTNTPLAKFGDMGSQLPPMKNQPTWVAGSSVQVAWGMRYNHGGGYQYRLCPASEPLTEACFQKMPLEFNRSAHALLWNNGTKMYIDGVFVDGDAVVPKNSTWARNPIPRINDDNIGLANETGCDGHAGRFHPACYQFPAPCPQDNGTLPWSTDGSGQGWCSGDWTMGSISDEVIVPKDIKPGKYVLGWRWDCEETAQVWQNCADINIVATSESK